MHEMATQTSQSIKLFYCYAREDHVLRDKLDEHLTTLHRIGLITTWYDGEIVPGASWEEEIEIHLDTADIILLLISPAFIRSDYCYSKEMERALERHHAREARVVPILLRPVDWVGTPFSALQMLPSNARPVTLWPDSDEAFKDVAEGIRKVVNGLIRQRHPKDTQHHYTSLKETGTIKATTPSTQGIPSLTSFSAVWQHFSRRKFVILLIIVVCLLLLIGGSTRLFYTGYYLPNQQHASATATALAVSTRTARAVATATAAIANATAALATGQNPYPPYGGALLLNDPLRENTKNPVWDEGTTPNVGFCTFRGGAYHVAISQAHQFWYCSDYSSTFSDFAYQVQMAIIKGDTGGISFRISGSGSLYYFYIDTQGNYELDVNENHNFIRAISRGSSPAIKTGYNQPNLIAVVAQGNSFDLYVNLQHLVHVNNTTFSTGQVGVIVIDRGHPTEVVFRYAKVWKL